MYKRIPFLILCILMLRGTYLCAQPTKSQLLTLDSTLSLLHRQAMFNGTVLVADHGRVMYQRSCGVADVRTRAPLLSNSAFNLASVSKQFMAMMAMILKEQGKLRYDDKVQQYLPTFPYANITIRHLLTHTSGLPEYFDLALDYRTTLDTLTNAGLVDLLAEVHPALEFTPGEKWNYCNTGYVLLASVIEKAAGMTVDAFFKKTITGPLGMNDTYIYTLAMKTSPPNRVFGFRREGGKPVMNDLVRLDGVVGDGNVYASAQDLLKWDRALYTEKLVHAPTLKEAFTPVKLNDGTTYPYGFGWFIDSTGNKVQHTGSWVGFLNEITRDMAHQQTVIILTSGSDGVVRTCVKAILSGQHLAIPKLSLIQNVQLIDGTGLAARPCSVRLRDDRIWEIGDLQPLPEEPVTDAHGLTLAPGFIDSHSHHFGGFKENPNAIAVTNQGITTIVIGQDGESWLMDTLQNVFARRKVAVNVATYVGHTTLRGAIMGENDMLRMAKPEEVERMKTLLQSEMKKGALGLSTGLEYEHAFYSNRNEVIELAKVTAAAGGRYISHIRSEDIRLDEAIEETIEIGRQAHLPVQISHIKIAIRDHWGMAPNILAQLEHAREEGIDITADCYPYTFWNSTLRVLFPNRDYTNPASAELAVTQLCDPEKSIVVAFAPDSTYADKPLAEIARIRHESNAATLMYLVAEAERFQNKHPDYEDNVEGIMGKSMDEKDVEQFLAWPHTNICSDGSWGSHPRGHGAFTRVLGPYVHDQKIMPLETAIYKMTGLTAQHLGITDRGIVAPGYYADLVLFDPATVRDNASIQTPHALSNGIEKVWVNGQIVLSQQQPTQALPGKLIKRQATHE